MSAILRWVIIISIYLFIFTSKVFATFPIFPISFCILNRLTGRLISYTLMHLCSTVYRKSCTGIAGQVVFFPTGSAAVQHFTLCSF